MRFEIRRLKNVRTRVVAKCAIEGIGEFILVLLLMR